MTHDMRERAQLFQRGARLLALPGWRWPWEAGWSSPIPSLMQDVDGIVMPCGDAKWCSTHFDHATVVPDVTDPRTEGYLLWLSGAQGFRLQPGAVPGTPSVFRVYGQGLDGTQHRGESASLSDACYLYAALNGAWSPRT